MKTPDEIKMALKQCMEISCDGCPYDKEAECGIKKNGDALALIQQLEAQNAELEQVKRERNAAVKDLMVIRSCEACVNDDTKDKLLFACAFCGNSKQNWRWRGLCKENGGKDE